MLLFHNTEFANFMLWKEYRYIEKVINTINEYIE